MIQPAGDVDDAEIPAADQPLAGSPVSLIPTDQPGPALAARLERWFASPGGLAISAEVRIDRSAVDILAGASVWATFRTAGGGQLLVASLARPTVAAAEILELTGVAMLAREPRRDAIRAGLRREVRLLADDIEHPATTLDLSSGGCRVQVAEPEAFPVGRTVDVHLDLAAEGPLRAAGEIVRSDAVAHEIAVRFLDLSEADEAALDAVVYGTISAGR